MDNQPKRGFVADLRRSLAAWRKHHGVSQRKAAVLLGISEDKIKNIELDRSSVGEDELEIILRAVRHPGRLIADELRNIADWLDSPTLSSKITLRSALDRLTELQMRLEDFDIAIQEETGKAIHEAPPSESAER